jgi:hypothetical protein
MSRLRRCAHGLTRQQLHKLNGEPALKALAHGSAAERAIVDGIVVTAVAMKMVAQ